MAWVRLILGFPISLVYGVAVWVRNTLFNKGILRQTQFIKPIIVVGNLTTGGTGKTPHVAMLIAQLQAQFNIAVLSRGYGRSTKGFLWVDSTQTAATVGDEPLQLATTFAHIPVAVAEDRVLGINTLLAQKPNVDLVILDDAFQHRYVKPTVSIVLFDYTTLHQPQALLPAGNLREPLANARRATFRVLTKVPNEISQAQLQNNPTYQTLSQQTGGIDFISRYHYTGLVAIFNQQNPPNTINHIVLVTGIANPAPMQAYLAKTYNCPITPIRFADHHPFTEADIATISSTFNNIATPNTVLITTQKDSTRLLPYSSQLNKLPFYYLGVEARVENSNEFISKITALCTS